MKVQILKILMKPLTEWLFEFPNVEVAVEVLWKVLLDPKTNSSLATLGLLQLFDKRKFSFFESFLVSELLDSRHNRLVPPTRYSMHLLPSHLDLGLGIHKEVVCCSFWLQTYLPLVCAKFGKSSEKSWDEETILFV